MCDEHSESAVLTNVDQKRLLRSIAIIFRLCPAGVFHFDRRKHADRFADVVSRHDDRGNSDQVRRLPMLIQLVTVVTETEPNPPIGGHFASAPVIPPQRRTELRRTDPQLRLRG